MFDALARLAHRRNWLVVLAATFFFVVAGTLGSGVAGRLDPFGADDPDTESVIAEQRLQAAGFREIGGVVLIDGVDVRSSQGRQRIEAITRRLETDPEVAAVSGFLTTGSRDFVSRNGRATYLAVALKPTDDHGTPGRRRADRRFAHWRTRGQRRRARARGAPGQQAGRARPTHRRALRLPAALPPLPPLLPQPRRRAATAARRRSRDRRHLADPARGHRADFRLDLRPQRHYGAVSASTTASSSSPATAKRSPAPVQDSRHCGRHWARPGAPSSSAPSPSLELSPHCSCSHSASSTRWESPASPSRSSQLRMRSPPSPQCSPCSAPA